MSVDTYLITGASSGLGASLALQALKAGHRIVGTARNVSTARDAYPEIERNGGIWLELDVTRSDAQAIVEKATHKYNVTVLVNNAGYAYKGPLEELSHEKIRSQWETNVFGLFACTRGALSYMRTQKRGTIVNISSTAGMRGVAGYSMYCGSKFAVEGASEALAAELAPFNIRMLIVEPGAYRTNFQAAAEGTEVSSAYVGTPADAMPKQITSMHGKQPGDPDKAAAAIVEVVGQTGRGADGDVKQCLRLPLGKDAVQAGLTKAHGLKKQVETMRHISESAVYSEF